MITFYSEYFLWYCDVIKFQKSRPAARRPNTITASGHLEAICISKPVTFYPINFRSVVQKLGIFEKNKVTLTPKFIPFPILGNLNSYSGTFIG